MPNAAKPSRGISPPSWTPSPSPSASPQGRPSPSPRTIPSPPGISVGASLVGALPSVVLANAGTPPPTPYQHVIPNPVKRSTPNYHYYENSPFRVYKSLPPRWGKVRACPREDGGWGCTPYPTTFSPADAVREQPFICYLTRSQPSFRLSPESTLLTRIPLPTPLPP